MKYSTEWQAEWQEASHSEVVEFDEFAEKYKNWEIRLSIPNGGIIGASVLSPDGKAWWTWTEPDERYGDEDWHIELAKRFIDSQNP